MTEKHINTPTNSIAALEAMLSEAEKLNKNLTQDLDRAKQHGALRKEVHLEELRRAQQYSKQVHGMIEMTKEEASTATHRIRQIEAELQNDTESLIVNTEKPTRKPKKTLRSLTLLRACF